MWNLVYSLTEFLNSLYFTETSYWKRIFQVGACYQRNKEKLITRRSWIVSKTIVLVYADWPLRLITCLNSGQYQFRHEVAYNIKYQFGFLNLNSSTWWTSTQFSSSRWNLLHVGDVDSTSPSQQSALFHTRNPKASSSHLYPWNLSDPRLYGKFPLHNWTCC